jgi:type 1 fimbria pilin
MTFKKVVLAAAISLGMASTAQAASTNGSINFDGEVQAVPCAISSSDLNKAVTFGTLSQAQLTNGGSSAPKTFDIALLGCDSPTAITANIAFNGTSGFGDTFGVTGVSNIGVLLSSGGTVITPGSSIPKGIFNGDNVIGFEAQVLGAPTAVGAVGTGTFTSTANFSITYS